MTIEDRVPVWVSNLKTSNLKSGDVFRRLPNGGIHMYLGRTSYNGKLELCAVNLETGYVHMVAKDDWCIPLPNAKLVIEQQCDPSPINPEPEKGALQ